jgi:RNA polymerase sigma factor (sigma-70 family)
MTLIDNYPECSYQECSRLEVVVRFGVEEYMSQVDLDQALERRRGELHVHCYRMLGSYTEAEDLVQETFVRAWRHRDDFEPGTNLRAWLYRIATNVRIDAIRSRRRRVERVNGQAEATWLEPYPDALLDRLGDAEPGRGVPRRARTRGDHCVPIGRAGTIPVGPSCQKCRKATWGVDREVPVSEEMILSETR